MWVEANDKSSALQKVKTQYGNEEIILDAEDLKETTIKALNERL